MSVGWMTLDWPRCAQLEEFVLDECSLPGTHVAELLRLCPNLKKLEVTWADEADVDYCNPAFKEIGTAISKHTPLLTSLKLQDNLYTEHCILQSTRLCYSLRDLQHLTHVELNFDSLWCHPVQHVDAVNDNLPSSIETLRFSEYSMPRQLPIDDNIVGEDATLFDAACTAEIHSNNNPCRCRIRDLRRLLTDERLHRLRRVVFNPKWVVDGPNMRDPHALRHIWTAAVRGRGWKMLERPVKMSGSTTYRPYQHEAVLYRESPYE